MASASAEIGALRVRLSIDAGEWSSGLKDAEGALAKFGHVAKTAAIVAAGALTSAFGIVALEISHIIKEADNFNQLAQKVGMSVEEISKLAYAAKLADIETDALKKGLVRLSTGIEEGLTKGTGEAMRAFEAMGIKLRHTGGTAKTAMEIFVEMSDKFKSYKSSSAEVALATSVFGQKLGADLIPLLNEGKDGLNKMFNEAERAGVVFGKDTAQAADNFRDNLTKLMAVVHGLALKLAENLLPWLESMTEKFIDWINENRNIETVGNTIIGIFSTLGENIKMVAGWTEKLAISWAALKGIMTAKTFDEMKTVWNDFMNQVTVINDGGIATLKERWGVFWVEAGAQGRAAAATEGGNMAAPAMAAKTQAELAMEEMKRKTALAMAEQKKAIEEGKRLMEASESPLDEMNRRLQRNLELLHHGAIGWEFYAQAAVQAQMKAASGVLNLAGQLAGALKTMFGNSKLAAVAHAVINTAEAITKALATYGPTPWGFAAAGVAAVAGAAQIATIKSTTEKGGTTPKAPTNTAAATGAATSAPSAPGGTLMVQGINPGSLFSGDAMRSLAEQLLQYQRDGGKVVFA